MKTLYLAFAAFAFTACDRGCVSKVTTGLRGESPVASELAVQQDCPTGLARCVEGAVEITEGRASCVGCPCAWKRVRVCERGCVAPNVELVRDSAESLCKEERTTRPWWSTPRADAGNDACPNEGERFLCRHGMVYACASTSAVPVSECTNGCASDGETLADPIFDIASATQVMCVHDRRVVVSPPP